MAATTVSLPTTQTATPNEVTAGTNDALQVEIFNFGRVTADLESLTLADFERAGALYFPHLHEIEWAKPLIREIAVKLANKPETVHVHDHSVPDSPTTERINTGQRNKPGTPWYHDDCGRVSDCLVNDVAGLRPLREPVCARCQQCIDDACPMKSPEDHVAADVNADEAPLDIEPDEDESWTTPAIILNEKGERIGTTQV
jgi:hypothetical protein